MWCLCACVFVCSVRVLLCACSVYVGGRGGMFVCVCASVSDKLKAGGQAYCPPPLSAGCLDSLDWTTGLDY